MISCLSRSLIIRSNIFTGEYCKSFYLEGEEHEMTLNTTRLFASLLLPLFVFSSVFMQIDGGGGKKADIKEGLGSTWKGPGSTVIARLFKKKTSGGSASTTSAASGKRNPARAPKAPPAPIPTAPMTASITFRPGPNPGVDQALVNAFVSTPAEKQALITLFQQLKQSYEEEVAKDGKSNNLAAAMTFFIASNVVSYHRTEMPSEPATEKLFIALRDVMMSTPEIAKMTNAEKQQMHDWLVYMGGFILSSYLIAKQSNDRKAMDNSRLLASLSTKIVLGIDISTVKFTKDGLSAIGSTAHNLDGTKSQDFVSTISILSPTRITPPGFSGIRFSPNSTAVAVCPIDSNVSGNTCLASRYDASVFSGSLPSNSPRA